MPEVADQLDSEVEILQRCRRGRREAFAQIVDRYGRDAYRIALGLVGNHEDAMELSQEAFYRAFRNLKLLRADRKFFPWFYQILRNLCFSHLRRRRRHVEQALPECHGVQMTPADGDWFCPDAVLERTETRDAVWRAIGQLSEKHREVIILRHFQNLSYDEMARHLACCKGTIMSRLYNARKQLKECLEQEKGGVGL